jgi:hypothetical protein
VEIELMAQNHKAQLAMEEANEKEKQHQQDNKQKKLYRASELPHIDGTVHLARTSLRLFLAAASLWEVTLRRRKYLRCGFKLGSWTRSRRRCAEAREEALVIKARLSKLKLPTVKEVVSAQKKDKETVALREQLRILLDKSVLAGLAELRRQGYDAARIMMLSQYSFGEGGVLMHAPTLPHYYIKGEPCDSKGKPLSSTEAAEQRMESMWVLPKSLQQDICYLHHYAYSRGAAHPQWYDLVTQINEAGYGIHLEGHEDFVFSDVQSMQGVLSCYPHQDL